jgi:hypothetical protein
MVIGSQDYDDRSLQPRAAWAEVWHLWTVIIPRRSIADRLLYGRVWRRHDGRHWIYKKFVEYDVCHNLSSSGLANREPRDQIS